jgi:hypothetical protein
MHFRSKEQPPLTVIAVYQVCHNPTNAVGNTAWHQQKRALMLQNRPDHPRKAFIDDLIKLIQDLQSNHHDIIVGGDFNEDMEEPTSGLLRLVTTTQLCDPWITRHPQLRKFRTYRHGT